VANDLITTLLSFIYSGCALLIMAAVFVAAAVWWQQTWKYLVPGLILAGVVLVMKVPLQVATLIYFDPTAVMQQANLGQHTPGMDLIMDLMVPMIAVFTLFGVVLATIYMTIQVPLALGASETSFPVLTGGEKRFAGWLPAAALGCVLGVGSGALFYLVDVEAGDAIKMMMSMIPGLDLGTPLALIFLVLPAVTAVAISEEVVFRGLIQGWLTRWLGGSLGAAIVAIVVATTLWTFGHAANADNYLAKMAQIFLCGLIFGALARRYSVESAIVGHVSLNASAVGVGLVFGLLGLE